MRLAIRWARAKLILLPKDSPDLNPIEQVFAKLKPLLRKAAARTVETLVAAVGQFLDAYTTQECAKYFVNSGYRRTLKSSSSSVETDRAHALEEAKEADTMVGKIIALQRIRGIGENFAAVLAQEVFYCSFGNRRQLASYVGITPMPYQSGGMDRDRSISRAGNPRARAT